MDNFSDKIIQNQNLLDVLRVLEVFNEVLLKMIPWCKTEVKPEPV